jgi:hypothetical protein
MGTFDEKTRDDKPFADVPLRNVVLVNISLQINITNDITPYIANNVKNNDDRFLHTINSLCFSLVG